MSVMLKGQNGNEVELGFLRDSYPEMQDGAGDSWWTTVNFRVATRNDAWEESAPCLSLVEFEDLADWLEAVGSEPGGAGEISEVELLEPELKFSLSQQDAGGVTIRVGFHLRGRPEAFEVDAETDLDYVDVYMTREGVRAAAATLRSTLEKVRSNGGKDDTSGATDAGILGDGDEDLNIVDGVAADPPGAGDGEDSAGET